jgi:phosphatidate cytidylyltransferase
VRELTKRVLVAVWGIPVLLALSYFGSYYFLALILVINGRTLYEFYALFEKKQVYAYRWLGISLGSTFLILAFYDLLSWMIILGIGSMILVMLSLLVVQQGTTSFNMATTLAGLSYVSGFLACLLYLRLHFEEYVTGQIEGIEYGGGMFLIILWISIWICDTAAYFGGRLLGRHKLAPVISPNKTIEGGIFGLVFGILTFWVLGVLLLPSLKAEYLWMSGAVVGIFGQLGDLVESRFKRDTGVKDTSPILPGHGGFLDRFDSIIFISPFLLIIFQYLEFLE